MRSFVLVCSIVFSLSSLAGTTIRLESEDYTLEATLTPDPDEPTFGEIHAPNAQSGDCFGTYHIDFSAELLTITFGDDLDSAEPIDDEDSDDFDGGCANENMEVNITSEDYKRLEKGEEIDISFMSQLFEYSPREGRARVIGRN